ncbi:fumarylacetoacetate hydrolase family protein [Streptomyces sp. OE57]|uniref:fumarylacetoacetate hydrolase family protein n=1 Tax=Streptomyces lacaronensis TaxID=3379885 RepID=UPI0039B75D6E
MAALVEGNETRLLPYADVGALLAAREAGEGLGGLESQAGESGPAVEAADFAPLVTRPSKVICVGLNYKDHILEMGRELPAYPTLFAKFADTLAGARDELRLSAASEGVDWEAELAVVVGREVRNADRDAAQAAIGGFTVANDISMRDWQRRTGQWLQGKAFESSTPLGPVMVTPDEVDGAADLEISCTVDGVVKQRSRTSQLLFTPADIVAYVSAITTLRPGDVLLTGTPGGVGAGRSPAEFLRPGQVLTTTIEGIGSCRNACVEETS